MHLPLRIRFRPRGRSRSWNNQAVAFAARTFELDVCKSMMLHKRANFNRVANRRLASFPRVT